REGFLQSALEVDSPDGSLAAIRLDSDEVGHRLPWIMAISRAPMIGESPPDESVAIFRPGRSRGLGACSGGARSSLARSAGSGASEPLLFEFRRPIAAHLEARPLCGEPCFPAKALAAAHGDVFPTARARDCNQTSDYLRILAARRQAVAPIDERAR